MQKDIISSFILKSIKDINSIYVFPSEISAYSNLISCLEASDLSAITSKRFISWDAFKSNVFQGNSDYQAISKPIRTLFTNELLKNNSQNPFIHSIIPTEYASVSMRFSNSIQKALPGLRNIPEQSTPVIEDWRTIKKIYSEFLDKYKLYEPAWQKRVAQTSQNWKLIFPDLTTDWSDYETAIKNMDNVEAIYASSLGKEKVTALHFENSLQEIRWILLDIRNKIENGADSSQFSITITEQEAITPFLEREAHVAGIPLDIRSGDTLDNSAGGRLLDDITTIISDNMSFESIRRLLLDCSRPWKEKDIAKALLNCGIQNHIVSQIPELNDIWDVILEDKPIIHNFYKNLKFSAIHICSSKSFKELKASFSSFYNIFFDKELWTISQDNEIARCITELDTLIEAESSLQDMKFENVVQIYSSHLKNIIYMPQSTSTGIKVYNYPVSAGLQCDYHYVMNLSEKATQVSDRPMAYLPENERQNLCLTDRELSTDMLRLYSISGKNVYMSFSTESPSGVKTTSKVISPEKNTYCYTDWIPNIEEECLNVNKVFPLQKENANSALETIFKTNENDWATATEKKPEILPPELNNKIQNKYTKNGVLELSPTLIDNYKKCIFYQIYSNYLKIRELETDVTSLDNLLIGNIYHNAFKAVMESLSKSNMTIPQKLEDIPVDIPKLISEILISESKDSGPMIQTLLECSKATIISLFIEAIQLLLKNANGTKPIIYDDRELSTTFDDGTFVLKGRADLVSSFEDNKVIIVDYKKSVIPSIEELEINENNDIEKSQMPAYTKLLISNGFVPKQAFYLSIENKKTIYSYGNEKAAIQEDQVKEIESIIEDAAKKCASIIKNGYVYTPSNKDKIKYCGSCSLAPLCRTNYSVR